MKIHKTEFANGEMCKYNSMPFSKFKKMHGKTNFKYYSIEQVYVMLGGDEKDTIPKEKVESKKKDKTSE